MIRLEDINPGLALEGLEPTRVVTVVAVVPLSMDSIQVIYRPPEGGVKECNLTRASEAGLSIATAERPWSFDGDGEAFKLTVEAKRIDLAFLFDPMMAVHTSNVDPHLALLPFQAGNSGIHTDDGQQQGVPLGVGGPFGHLHDHPVPQRKHSQTI